MNWTRRTGYVAFRLACRLALGAVFLWAGLEKAFDRQESILAVDGYDVLPERLVEPVAVLLPWVEIGVAALLILGLFVRFAGIATAVLSGVFIVGLVQAKVRGLDISCGCFGGGGVGGGGVTWWDIVRDIPILLGGIYLALRPHGPLQLDNVFLVREDDDRGPAEDADGEREAGADQA